MWQPCPLGCVALAATAAAAAQRADRLLGWVQEERDKGYDSDTAEAVQRRLAELRQESEGGRARPAARLYDERLERQQLQRQQLRGRSKHTNRSRSRSQERRRRRERRRSRSRSRSRSRRRGHHRSRSRSRGRRRRSRSRSRSTERRACHNSSMLRQRSRSRGRGWSPGSKAVGGGVQVAGVGPGAAAGLQRYDFEALIPGYAAMSAPQVHACLTCAPAEVVAGLQPSLCEACSCLAMPASVLPPSSLHVSAEAASKDSVPAGTKHGPGPAQR